MCFISEKYKEESTTCCFKDAAVSADNACGIFFLDDLLVALIFKIQSFEPGGHKPIVAGAELFECPASHQLERPTSPNSAQRLADHLAGATAHPSRHGAHLLPLEHRAA